MNSLLLTVPSTYQDPIIKLSSAETNWIGAGISNWMVAFNDGLRCCHESSINIHQRNSFQVGLIWVVSNLIVGFDLAQSFKAAHPKAGVNENIGNDRLLWLSNSNYCVVVSLTFDCITRAAASQTLETLLMNKTSEVVHWCLIRTSPDTAGPFRWPLKSLLSAVSEKI